MKVFILIILTGCSLIFGPDYKKITSDSSKAFKESFYKSSEFDVESFYYLLQLKKMDKISLEKSEVEKVLSYFQKLDYTKGEVEATLDHFGWLAMAHALVNDQFPDLVPPDILKRYGESILMLQKPNGSFHRAIDIHWNVDKTPSKLNEVGPGVHGLIKVYQQTGEQKFLVSAMNSITSMGERIKRLDPKLMPRDPWLLINIGTLLSLNSSFVQKHTERYLNYSNKLALKVLSFQDKDSGSFSKSGNNYFSAISLYGLKKIASYLKLKNINQKIKSGKNYLANSKLDSHGWKRIEEGNSDFDLNTTGMATLSLL